MLLAACVVGTLPLELVLHTRVYLRWRRLLAAVLPVVVVFGVWDVLEIRAGAWHYDRAYLVGLTLPGRLPVEDLLFGFAMVLTTLALWVWAGRRVARPAPAGSRRGRPPRGDAPAR